MLSVRLRSVCRFLAPLFLLGLASPGAHAQQPGKDGPLTVAASNTVLNKYAVLSADASAGATSIDVTNPGGADGLDPATLTLNDLLLIIQMQGATMDTSYRVVDFGSGNDESYAVAMQSDGKIVVAGYSFNGTNQDFAVMRFNADGTPDTSFDGDGALTTPIAGGNDQAIAVAIQGDGKIVVAGFADVGGGDNDFALVRYNTDGSLDLPFGAGGKVTTPILGTNDQARAVAIQDDGMIVLTGWANNGANNDVAVVRYDMNGVPDGLFGVGGIVTTPIGASDDEGFAVAIQTDGKIVVAGDSNSGPNDDIVVLRYLSGGGLDPGFGVGGITTTPIGGGDDSARALVLQTDGKIVVSGSTWNGTDFDFVVVRYDVAGVLDGGFGAGGIRTIPIGTSNDLSYGVALQSDGRIVSVGWTHNGDDWDFGLTRLTTNGSLDTSFDVDGKVSASVGNDDAHGEGVVIHPDGRIFVVGPSYNSVDLDFTLVGFNPDGTFSYGTVLAYGSAGLYELVPVSSVGGGTITLGCSLSNSYAVAGNVQVIRVPQYSSLTINGGASVISPAWNGQYGGVVALDVQSTTTIDGQIRVDRRGFRGGSVDLTSVGWDTDWPDLASPFVDLGGQKGEGIAGDVNAYDNLGGRYGRGAPANGGGGGSAHNGAGGGGANGNAGGRWTGQGYMDGSVVGAGAWTLDPGYIANGNALTTSPGGGRGGYSYSDIDLDALTNAPGAAGWGGNWRRDRGGLGGHPVPNSSSRLFMGGGGGAADANGGGGGAGGNGGGIVVLVSDTVTGTGSVDARGEPGDDTAIPHEDPAGGGGAGGSIVVTASSLAGINIRADGGAGGNQGVPTLPVEAEGPGGGGSGGFIAISAGVVTRTADGGASGTTVSPALAEFPTNGATRGAPGQPNEFIASLPGRCLVSACAPQINYRSVGTDAGILHQDGLATINAGSNVVNFSGAANIPTYVGRGDELIIAATTFYILSRVSSTEVTVQTPAGATLTNQAYTIGRAHNTFQAWETANGGDLVGDGRREVAYAYDDGARGFSDFTAGAVISGSTTDACHYMHITVAPGQRHLGRAGAGVSLDGVTAAQVFQIRDEFTRIEWLQINNATVVNGVIFVDSEVTAPGQNAFLSHLLIENFNSASEGALQLSHDATVRNSIIYNGDRGIQVDEGATVTIENVTVYNMTTYGIQAGDQGVTDVTIRNTISVGSGWNDFALAQTISYFGFNMFDTTLSFDPVACPGCVGNNQTPPAPLSNLFVATTGSVDLHLQPGTNAVDTGLDLSSSFSSDIDEQIRALGAGWDIGADETFVAGGCPTNNPIWYDANWLYRIPVVVQSGQVTVSLTDFPAVLQLSSDGGLAAFAQTNGEDILFTLADGITKLSHEIELFDDATGELVAWIKVPFLSSGTDTVLYMYYGNGTVGNQEDIFGTWTNGYEGVWHLSEASGAGAYILNSVENDHHGTPDSTFFTANGRIGGARDFVDSGVHAVDLGNSTVFFDGWSQFSYEFWMRNEYTTDAEWEGVGEHRVLDENGGFTGVRLVRIRRQGFNAAGKGEIQSDIQFAGAGTQFVIESIDRQAWNHVLYSYNGSNLKVFIDGTIVGNTPIPGDALIANSGSFYSIGGNGNAHRGTMDEVRFASVGRADGWVSTQYNNQNNPAGFMTVCSAATAVELESFEANATDDAIEVTWTTASELDNLGFHLYRSSAAEGPYQRLTSSLIPGLGNSPVGAEYSFQDRDVLDGVNYFYELEDIETTGRRTRHGPVTAAPQDEEATAPPTASTEDDGAASGQVKITYGDPRQSALRVLHRDDRGLVLELRTGGFFAEPLPDGTVAIEIPGFVADAEEGRPDIPIRRAWIEAAAGRAVRLVSARRYEVERISGLEPRPAAGANVVMDEGGAVRAETTDARRRRAARGFSAKSAHVVSVGYQGNVKKALVEMAPLRWDDRRRQLVLAKRLVLRFRFTGTERKASRRARRRPSTVRQLVVQEKGLYSVRFEALFPGRNRGVEASRLRLSRLGEAVPYHVEPASDRFGRGSTLYFFSEGASLNPYGQEAVYELETGANGISMAVDDAPPAGSPLPFYWKRSAYEKNRYYQAALVNAPDVWLWELVFARETKAFPFVVRDLVDGIEGSRLEIWLQGASDLLANPDHHVRVYVNGQYVTEMIWDGKEPRHIAAEVFPGMLREGDNVLEIENVGDTEAEYSMVMLDRFAIRYPRRPILEANVLEGGWSESGIAAVRGLGSKAYAVDVTDAPRWLVGLEQSPAARFAVEPDRDYFIAAPGAVLEPEVRIATTSGLLGRTRRVDYLVIGPKLFLDASRELLEFRRRQGLRVAAVAIEDIYAELGFGEARPEAVRDLIAHAYHAWGRPDAPLRYVLLLGDASYDFKDYLGLGVENHVPALMVRTRYLWTASDPTLAAVHGDDPLPDVSIGRLPASSAEEVEKLAHKIIAYETNGHGLEETPAPIVFVTDNPDQAGDFVHDAEAIASELLEGRDVRLIHLAEHGTLATRSSILDAFDEGASLMSYLGHGGIHLWASENILDTKAITELSPQTRQPILLTMNCLNGYFHFPFFESLSEALVETEGRGAIAAFSPTGLSLNGPADLFHQELVKSLLSGEHDRLGDAVMAASAAYAETGAFPELLRIYHLLGDPALKLR